MPLSDPHGTYRFGDFELDVAAYELRRRGRTVRIERRPMDLLILLVERRRQLVQRSEIAEQFWAKDVFVDVDVGVNTAIRKIRQALRDSPDAPSFVDTVPGKGYRFIADVEVVSTSPHVTSASDVLEHPALVAPAPRSEQEAWAAAAPRHEPKPHTRARAAVGFLVIALLAAGVAWAWLGARTPARVTIAVLPFENLSGDPDREYLADGLTDEAIASLGQIDPDHLSVIARTSVMGYKGASKTVGEIGRELKAGYVVEGSVRAEGGRLRITPKLVRVRDQVQIWSASYDSEPTSVLELERELSVAIAEQVRLRVSPDRLSALSRRHTRDTEAYDLYLRGRYFWNQLTGPTTRRAIEYYTRATVRDPRYALAWSGLADAYSAGPISADVRPGDVWPRARDAAANAVSAEPDLAEAQTSLALVNFWLDWNWAAAEAAYRRAIALDPRYPLAHRMLGVLLSNFGRHDEARLAMVRARELDPLYAMHHALSAQVALGARDYHAALDFARQATVIEPDFWIGYFQLGQVYVELGESDRAIAALNNAARLAGNNSYPISLRGYLFAKMGRTEDALDVLKTLEAISRERYVPPYAMALVYAGLGQRDAAVAWLERAFEARDVHLVVLPIDPKWDTFRADPRFDALVERCGFKPAGPSIR